MLIREPYEISPVTGIRASVADDIQAVIFSDLKASSIAELRAVVKVSSLLQLIDERLSTNTSRIEIFVPKRQILDRCQKTRCPYRVKIRDAQAETTIMGGVAVGYVFDDFMRSKKQLTHQNFLMHCGRAWAAATIYPYIGKS